MSASTIEWTDKTWNPVTGCDRVSRGCDNCYALSMAGRLKGMGSAKYQTDGRPETSGPGFGVQCHPDVLEAPLRWRKPRKVFVNSMSDLFHPQVPDEFIAEVFAVMWLAREHTFQVLTKRPSRARVLLSSDGWWRTVAEAVDARAASPGPCPGLVGMEPAGPHHPLDNAWLGVSVEDQERADQRIPLLLDTPAAVRFLSCEPLLGPVDLRTVPIPLRGPRELAVRRLDWVIVGGESGPGARPMDLAWARSLIVQCRDAGVACFVKQLGSASSIHAAPGQLPSHSKHGDPDEWPLDLRVREFPEAVT